MVEYEAKEIQIVEVTKTPVRTVCDICGSLLHDNCAVEEYHSSLTHAMEIPFEFEHIPYFHVEEKYTPRYTGDPSVVEVHDYCQTCMMQVFDNEIIKPCDDQCMIDPSDPCTYMITQKVGLIKKEQEESV